MAYINQIKWGIHLLPASLVIFSMFQADSSVRASDQTQKQDAQSNIQTLTNEAETLLDQWRGQTTLLDQAAEKLARALEQNPNYAKAYVQLGRFHIMSGYYHSRYFDPGSLEASERAIRKAIEIDPKLPEAFVLLGHLYTNMNRLPEAKNALVAAEKIGTTSPWLRLNWAEIYEREGKYDEAAANYLAVIRSDTKNVKALGGAYDKLRRYYVKARDLVKAEETYQAHIALEPRNAWARGNYASNLLCFVGDFDKAIEKAREALAIMEYGNARRTLALALYGKWATIITKNKDIKRAQPYFDEAHRLFPDIKRLRYEALRFEKTRVIIEALNQTGH